MIRRMDCADVEYELATNAGQPTTPAAAAHLETCDACRAARVWLARIDEALATSASWEPPPHFVRTIGLQGVETVRAHRPARGFLSWWPHLERAAVLALVWIGSAAILPMINTWRGEIGSAPTTSWLWVLAAGSAALCVSQTEPDQQTF